MKRVSVLAALALALCVGVPSVAAAPSRAGQVVHASTAPAVSVVSYSADELGDYVFFTGEVQNTYPLPVTAVVVHATAFDAAGKVVAEKDGLTFLLKLDPGERAPLLAVLNHAGARYDLKVTGFAISHEGPNRNFTITTGSPTTDPDGTLHYPGTITNNNLEPAEVSIVATYRDAAGKAVGSSLITVNDSDEIAAGASVPFELKDEFPPEYVSIDLIPDGIGQATTGVAVDWVVVPPVIGSTMKLTGTAKPGDAITFEQYGASGWAPIAGLDATADATTGDFTASCKVVGPAYVRAVSPSAKSPGIAILAAASTTLKASATSVKKGAKVTLSGTVKPATAGTVVTIQRKVGSKWTTLATAKLSASGAFTYAWVPKAAGTYVLRVTVPTTGLIQAGTSPSLTVKVK